ncbi:MAG: ATP-binding protein [Pseudomonadales bacterium]
MLSLSTSDSQFEKTSSLQSAAQALSEEGEHGLTVWLHEYQEKVGFPQMLIVDQTGEELLGRPFRDHGSAHHNGAQGEYQGVLYETWRPYPRLIGTEGKVFNLITAPPPGSPWSRIKNPLFPLGAVLLIIAATGLCAWVLSRLVTKPLEELRQLADAITLGNLHVEVDKPALRRKDEIGELARSFNAMASRLRTLIVGRQQLLRDVSHELRSPIARMQMAFGLARQDGQNDGHNLDNLSERLQRETERLESLVGQIMGLSQLDVGPDALKRQSLNLVQLLETIAIDADFECRQLGKRLAWQAPAESIAFNGDPHWLGSAIENAVRNAIRFTPQGKTVTLMLSQQDKKIIISVIDQGPGVHPEELGKIFNAFYQARTNESNEPTTGAGVGLAIAKRVIEAHGGTICAQMRNDCDGLEIHMRL